MDMPGIADVLIERDLIVRARDGVGLATDVYRPSGDGPFPVLIERTPYDKSAPSRSNIGPTAARMAPRASNPVCETSRPR